MIISAQNKIFLQLNIEQDLENLSKQFDVSSDGLTKKVLGARKKAGTFLCWLFLSQKYGDL